ncbi:MAG: SRPBCC domain-containing protein [Planctomycetota bacterium]
MTTIPRPDLSERPLRATCTRDLKASPAEVFAAFTSRFDSWFAQAGAIEMVPELGRPFFFYNRDDWGRHPHYGRFLELIENELVEMTWITGNGTEEGTQGAETILRIELDAKSGGTEVRLTHTGFVSDKSQQGHQENWPIALEILDEALA